MTTFGWTIFGVGLLILVGIGTGMYFLFSQPKPAPMEETSPIEVPVVTEEVAPVASSTEANATSTASTTP